MPGSDVCSFIKMKIKTNDTVRILAGASRGKTGKVLQVLPKIDRASVEGINLRTKNLKSRRGGEKGQRINFPAPVHLSNLALVCPKCGKNTRVGFKKIADNKKIRQCKKCQELIEA
ncbi:MAG: 50S ribosomal protein L24 [Parcubacteria group bacterium GW2011_GWA2_42_28]|nr:MAG: 50S ribosomal protein L24 [Parcubacteria group bacterium GW2011_GWA2_42_28]KKT56217.1 MAG: 50S ribosomal protein L24 [Parcubacteria group bacterium GW2011_GWC2_44_22]